MNTTETKKKYAFQTIVVPSEVRQEFTTLREELNSSDKQLSLAMWNIVMRNPEMLQEEVQNLKELAAHLKEVTKISKSEVPNPVAKAAKGKKTAAKKEVKPKKAAAKKTATKKKAKVSTANFEVVYDASLDEDNA